MRFAEIEASQWKEVKSIYMEAFPKRERKPFFVLKHSVKRGKARVFTASDENRLLGFAVAIPYQNMVMVDYLAVSGKIRSKKYICYWNMQEMQEILQIRGTVESLG